MRSLHRRGFLQSLFTGAAALAFGKRFKPPPTPQYEWVRVDTLRGGFNVTLPPLGSFPPNGDIPLHYRIQWQLRGK